VDSLIGLITFILIYVYGFFLTISFAGGCTSPKERRATGILCVSALLVQLVFLRLFGLTATWYFYPLIAHLPIALTLVFALKRPVGMAVGSVLAAYFCCQLPRWIASIFLALFGTQLAFQISYSLFIIPIFFLLKRYFTTPVYKSMSYSKRSWFLFGGLPVFFYVFDYITRVYAAVLYDPIAMVSEFLPTAMVLFYVAFVSVYHNEVQRRNQIELQNAMLAMQFEQARNDMFALRQIQEQTATYRHDMRHHFTMISGYLQSEQSAKATGYIKSAMQDIDQITPKRYCENITINLVFSAFSDKAEKLGVRLNIEANIADAIPINETALCTLFSNGLENAVLAAAQLPDEKQRNVRVNCQLHKGHILLFIKNPYIGKVVFQDHLPISDCPGHGFGSKSIKLIADMHGGYCSFDAKDGTFTLKVVLPFEPGKSTVAYFKPMSGTTGVPLE
jgi:two-component system sensor histidine kinase AgrC